MDQQTGNFYLPPYAHMKTKRYIVEPEKAQTHMRYMVQPEKAQTHMKGGFTHPKMAQTHMKGGFTHPEKAQTHMKGGFTHPEMAQTHMKGGFTHPKMAQTHMRMRYIAQPQKRKNKTMKGGFTHQCPADTMPSSRTNQMLLAMNDLSTGGAQACYRLFRYLQKYGPITLTEQAFPECDRCVIYENGIPIASSSYLQ